MGRVWLAKARAVYSPARPLHPHHSTPVAKRTRKHPSLARRSDNYGMT
uniref:Uncharacterized protein n=1 Tax=Fusarium oxysporum (strain Fo5176) TaxID=660025 RepID=A0A0D2YKS1_FUSOF